MLSYAPWIVSLLLSGWYLLYAKRLKKGKGTYLRVGLISVLASGMLLWLVTSNSDPDDLRQFGIGLVSLFMLCHGSLVVVTSRLSRKK